MRTAFRLFSLGFLALCLPGFSLAQYFGERVLEKSFEQTDFFFTSHDLIPFGIGSYKSVSPGLIDDPLLNLSLNPANLYADSLRHTYFYADFRSAREVREDEYYISPLYYSTVYDADVAFCPYPRFYVNTRKEMEPVFSAALLSRPLHAVAPNLFVGISYQAIAQDEKYYAIPQDIYRSVVGHDYNGMVAEAAKDIPIVDRYSGTDRMHQVGHFLTAFAGYDILPQLQAGVKLGRATFQRDGSVGSKNLWGDYQWSSYTSLWSNSEAREQEYSHWDFAAGIAYKPHESLKLGVTVGRLWGDATQKLTRRDSSFWGNGQINVGTDWNYYMNSGSTSQSWDHQGKSWYGGLHITSQLTSKQSLSFHYSYSKQDVNIALGSSVYDTSYSNYRYRSTEDYFSASQGQSLLSDFRSGGGTSITKFHRFLVAFHWQVEPKMNLDLGVLVETRDTRTNTIESIFADRYSRWSGSYRYDTLQYNYNYYDGVTEDKTLRWDFEAKVTTYSLPIILTWKASDYLELLIGLNRRVSSWEITDVTLAIFNYRGLHSLEGTTREESFGERYTQPKETVTDVQTAVLGGITVSPSAFFNVRLLVTPVFVDSYDGKRFQNLQWWIGVNLFP